MQRGSGDRTQRERADAGFTLIEQIVAMVVIIIVMLGLLSTLGATATGIITGRQRTIAVSLSKQVIERLQGADYTNVVTGSGVAAASPPETDSDGKYHVVGGPLEALVNADPALPVPPPYRTFLVAGGTSFSIRTFVTAVSTVAPAKGYRRITVIIEWPSTSPTSVPKHTERFSSFVFQVDNASYPSSSGSAESAGGLISVSGCLGSDIFDDVHVALPSARADTSASTLRSAISGAGSGASHVEVRDRATSPTCTPITPVGIDNCPRVSVDSIADNESGSTGTANWMNPLTKTFPLAACQAGATAGGVTVVAPVGTGTALKSHAKTDACTGSTCTSFAGTDDLVPFADAVATTSTGSSATFASGTAPNTLTGTLWNFDTTWKATAKVDHDNGGTGKVMSSAILDAPKVRIFSIPGVGTDGAVTVSNFTATASSASGDSATPSAVAFSATPTVDYWDATLATPGYTRVSWVRGTPYTAPTQTVVVGGRTVKYTLTVESQSNTLTATGAAPHPDALGQNLSVLRVMVVVEIVPSTVVTPTTTSTPVSTTAPAVTTTTIAPPPAATDNFTIVVDYGRVSAHGTWLAQAP